MHTRIPRSPVAMLLQQVSHAIVAEMIQEFINIVFFLGGGYICEGYVNIFQKMFFPCLSQTICLYDCIDTLISSICLFRP